MQIAWNAIQFINLCSTLVLLLWKPVHFGQVQSGKKYMYFYKVEKQGLCNSFCAVVSWNNTEIRWRKATCISYNHSDMWRKENLNYIYTLKFLVCLLSLVVIVQNEHFWWKENVNICENSRINSRRVKNR